MTSRSCWVDTRFARHNQCRMSSKKKKRSCPFSSAKGRPKMAKNTFDKEWTAKLARKATKGRFTIKKNCWMNSITIAITKPASRPKWAQAALKYCCKKLSKQRRLTKRSGRSWKADRLYKIRISSATFFFFLPSYCHFFQYLCLCINISRCSPVCGVLSGVSLLCACIFSGTFYGSSAC